MHLTRVRKSFASLLLLGFSFAAAAVAEGRDMTPQSFQLFSSAFQQGDPIPKNYTSQGENQLPPLRWVGAPSGTQEFALIVDDPDAPRTDPQNYPWVHWVVFAIPGSVSDIGNSFNAGAIQGRNSFGTLGWGGPLPPVGDKPHRYFFHLYALDTHLNMLAANPMVTKDQLLAAMQGHVLSIATLMGTYERTTPNVEVQKRAS
jgi:Raf kinase inhibitor-like YbhB/YbcL family protein